MAHPPTRDLRVLYFDGCPNWRLAQTRLKEACAGVGVDPDAVICRPVTTADQPEALGFRGSPTILVDGIDPFAHPDDPSGLACRLYHTAAGSQPVPTVEQLQAVLAP